jgi:hypothetical protein
MRYPIFSVLATCLILGIAPPVQAQTGKDGGTCVYPDKYCLDEDYQPEVTQKPICFTIKNTTDRLINGSVATFYEKLNDGSFTRHTSNVMLFPAKRVVEAKRAVRQGNKTKDDISHIKQSVRMCSRGPFIKGYLEFKIRSAFPVFSCWFNPRTAKPLEVYMKKPPGGGDKQPWADCNVTYPEPDSTR